MAVAKRIRFLALVLLVLAPGCGRKEADRTTPIGAYQAYQASTRSGRFEELYPLLVRDLQESIAKTHANVRRTAELVKTGYPPALRTQALADLGPAEVREAKTPQAFLAAMMRSAGYEPSPMPNRLSSKLKRLEEKPEGSGRFLITTLAGSIIEMVRGGDGLFYMVPEDGDVKLLHREYLKSLDRLAAAEQAVKAFRK